MPLRKLLALALTVLFVALSHLVVGMPEDPNPRDSHNATADESVGPSDLSGTFFDGAGGWRLEVVDEQLFHKTSFDGHPDGTVEGPLGAVLLAPVSMLQGTWALRDPGAHPQDTERFALFRTTSETEGTWARLAEREVEAHPANVASPRGAFAQGSWSHMPLRQEDHILYVVSASETEFGAELTGLANASELDAVEGFSRFAYSDGSGWAGNGTRIQSNSWLAIATVASERRLTFDIDRPSIILVHVEYLDKDPEVCVLPPSGECLYPSWKYGKSAYGGVGGVGVGVGASYLHSDAWFTDKGGTWTVDVPSRTGSGVDVRLYVFPLP